MGERKAMRREEEGREGMGRFRFNGVGLSSAADPGGEDEYMGPVQSDHECQWR